jgi:arylsulfatase A-like enzyme
VYFEHQGNAAVRIGKWKLVRARGKPWELYDLESDRTELNDLSKQHADKAEELQGKWQAWAQKVGVQSWPIKKKKSKNSAK